MGINDIITLTLTIQYAALQRLNLDDKGKNKSDMFLIFVFKNNILMFVLIENHTPADQ